ncbi:MAG: hypothetical protein H7A25_09865 [Leptospiraceae bacterium]|nr:hypothetical protein [Leptospiraceae bacterium]
MNEKFEEIYKGYQSTIAHGLWVFDRQQMILQLEGITHIPDIDYAEITSITGHTYKYGVFPASNLVSKSWKIIHDKEEIGSFRVAANLQHLYVRIFYQALTILITQFVKTLVVSVSIFYIFYMVASRHLSNLSRLAANLNFDNLEKPIRLKRKHFSDELDSLCQSLNQMRENLLSELARRKVIEEELKNLNEELEERVVQRTNELEKAKIAVESASNARNVFFTHMSHELRTPLNGILGYVQILKNDSSLASQQMNGLNVIEQSGNHLLSLINDVLDLAKVESGNIELHKTEFNLLETITNTCNIIRIRSKEKGIELCETISDDLPEAVFADERRLFQILLNLLGNAVKFTDKGRVTIKAQKVKTSVRDNSQYALLYFEITDTGIGISPIDLDRIFDPFRQVGDIKRRSEGTGLGLAITSKLLTRMGGELKAESQLNLGSKFWFELELELVASSKPSKIINGWPYEEPQKDDLKSVKVVPPQHDTLKKILEFAEFGDMDELQNYLDSLLISEKEYDVFLKKLKNMASQFKLREIKNLILWHIEHS